MNVARAKPRVRTGAIRELSQQRSFNDSNTQKAMATKTAKFFNKALYIIQNTFSEPPTLEDIGSGLQKAGSKALTMAKDAGFLALTVTKDF